MSTRGRWLSVWMNGQEVGRWHHTAKGGHVFYYADAWLKSPLCRPLSLSLPLRPADDAWRGEVVEHFFSNLLPEDPRQRQALRLISGAPSTSSFDLLAHSGLDCPGAIQLTRQGQPPPALALTRHTPLSEAQIEQLLSSCRLGASLLTRPEGLACNSVLAGAHDKLALTRHQGQWYLPQGGLLSSHILKLPIERHYDSGLVLHASLENAWLCQKIARAFDVEVADCELVQFGAQRALAVTRDDRRFELNQGWQLALPREDMCQAFALPPEAKYQLNGAKDCRSMARLLLGSTQAQADRLALLRQLMVFWLLCALDAHAKNFTIQLLPQGQFKLAAPLGVLSAYPSLSRAHSRLTLETMQAALRLDNRAEPISWQAINAASWRATARGIALPSQAVEQLMQELTQRTLPICAQIRKQLPARFPVAVAEPILQGVVHASHLLRASL